MKKKEFGKQNRALSDYSQKRQTRIRELIKETIEEAKKQQQDTNSQAIPVEEPQVTTIDGSEDQCQVVECID